MHISEKTLSRAYVRGRDVKPQRKDAGGRKSKQPPNLHQTKLRLSKVQEGLRTKNQTLQPTTRMQKELTTSRPKILVLEESAIHFWHIL